MATLDDLARGYLVALTAAPSPMVASEVVINGNEAVIVIMSKEDYLEIVKYRSIDPRSTADIKRG